MSANMSFSALSLFYITLLVFMFFFRERIKSLENKLYGYIIISNFIGVILAILCHYFIVNSPNTILTMVISKGLLVYYLTWITFFTVYVYVISSKKEEKEKKYNLYKKIFSGLYCFVLIFILILPLYFHNKDGIVYSYGPSANLLFVVIPLYMTSFFICMIKNLRVLKNKKFVPLFAFLVLGTIVTIIQKINPGLLLITATETFITFLMFFTIENPDVKIINELNKNRELVNKTFEDKSNFLFVTANQLKNPIKKIEEISRGCIENNKGDLEDIRDINNLSNNLLFQVNNVMDISSLTYSNIKVVNDKYNLNLLLNKIRLSEENKVKDGVKFSLNVSQSVPKYIYGDSNLLEQVLISLVENAIKYTSSGFIDLNVDCIVKYDMCRLIFTVEDSGLGMTIDKINELLLVDTELSEEELKRLDTKNININTIKKLVSKLGGYFTIKSEVGKGTEIKVVVDQKVDNNDDINLNNVTTNQKILLASSNKDLSNHILKILDRNGYAIDTSTYSNDILDRVRLNDKYAYIIIDDSMDKRAIEILKELKKNSKFNTKVIVMIDKSLNIIKNDLIKDGFYECIFKENIDKELERVLD